MAPPIVLFTYPESVVGRRTEWYLTLRGLTYHTCQVDSKMPRPVLDRLGIHYRRIPVLTVGRDIYCDSRCIIDHLERQYTEIPKLGSDIKSSPHENGLERILENWAFEGGLFKRTSQIIPPDASLVLDKEWLADRSELTGITYDAEGLKATLVDALCHTRLHLQIVEENLLADGRKWLRGGDSPSISDVHVLWIFDWMTRPKEKMGMKHAYPDLLNETNYPKTIAWVNRMEEAIQAAQQKYGAPKALSDDEVVKLVEESDYWELEQLDVDENDPTGLKKGDETDLIALDSAPATGVSRRDVGKLERLTVNSVAIGTQTKNGVDVRIHYQRVTVKVAKASNKPRLSASEIPKA